MAPAESDRLKPFGYDVPDEYEQQIETGLESLDVIPRGENWEIAQRVLSEPPNRADVKETAQLAEAAGALLDTFEQARYEGRDEDESTMVAIDSSGRLTGLEFGIGAATLGNHGLAAAIVAAWDAAEEERESGASALVERGLGLGRRA